MKKPRPAKSPSKPDPKKGKAGEAGQAAKVPEPATENATPEPPPDGYVLLPITPLTKAQLDVIEGVSEGKGMKEIGEELKRLPPGEHREQKYVTLKHVGPKLSPAVQRLFDQIMKAAPADLKADPDRTVRFHTEMAHPPGMPLAVWRSLTPEQQQPFIEIRRAWVKKENPKHQAREKAILDDYGWPAYTEYVRVLQKLHGVIGKELERVQDPSKGIDSFIFAGGRTDDGGWIEMPWPAIIRDALPKYAKALKDIVAKQEKCIALRRRACLNCGKTIPRELAGGKRRFCSPACSSAARQRRFRQRGATEKTLRGNNA